METCVLPQSLQVTTTNEQGTELGSRGLTIQHQDNASTTDTTNVDSRKSSSASLSDLIPAAAAALRTRQELQRNQQQTNINYRGSSSHPTTTTTPQDSTLYHHQQQSTTNSTPFARALTKVKLQVQTKRLKERYLSHEWIRLALGLPVDLSRINLHHCYYSREQADNVGKRHKSTQPDEKTDTMPPASAPAPAPVLSSTSSPPSPAPSNTTISSTLLSDNDNKDQQQSKELQIQHDDDSKSTTLPKPIVSRSISATTTPPASPSSSRTGEIATWYEWKFDRSKFSVEEVEGKVDRLRTTKLRDKLASPP
ncbi:hypothetical protein BCR42DRAFT_402118 [Absidia repens]|uniref:Uncharacterized protein n=1 Tax=Absidia repens TaxID=90262 RepID=A0A1X2IXL8_9FUNG|nr:hypothetical protein BCR42DRAFT_402118 [Absidia repens]